MRRKLRRFWRKLTNPLRPEDGDVWRQAALVRLSTDLAATIEEQDVCDKVVEGLHETLGYDFLALFLVDESTGKRMLVAHRGFIDPPSPLGPGEGLSERPMLNGKLHYTPDVDEIKHYYYGMGGSEVDVPIRIDGEVRGVLTAESKQKHAFNEKDFEILTAAAHQAGLAIEKSRLLAAERKRVEELDALQTTLAELTAELDLSTLLEAIVVRAAALLDATGGELGLYDEKLKEVRIVVSHNLGEHFVGTSHPLGEGAMGRVAESGEPLVIDDYHEWEGGLPQYPDFHSTMAVPLCIGDRLVGVFTTTTSDPVRKFDADDLHLLTMFAQQAAVAIENARLFEQAQREIIEREKAQEEILRQKEYYESLFINNPVAVVTADNAGTIISWNPMAEQLFGYRSDEVLGENIDDIVANHESIREEGLRYTKQMVETGAVRATTKRSRKDGTLVDVDLLALPVLIAGENVGFIAIYHDISEIKRIESELQRQKEYYESLFIYNPVAVITTTLEGDIVSWNPMAERLFGYTQEEVEGKSLNEVVARHPDLFKQAQGYSVQLEEGDWVQEITRRNRKDGSLVDVEILALPVIVGKEKIGYIVIYVDITAMQEARREAEAANRAKSVFLASMSHELRTPLNAILGFAQLMDSDENLNQYQRENLNIINQSGEHLLSLINDVLVMSKIEAGKVTIDEKDFDLFDLLDGLEDLFKVRADERGLSLKFQRSKDLPRYVCTDEGRLRQILVNLLGNAIKFTDTGTIELRVNATSNEEKPEEIIRLFFEVEDTGLGIETMELERIFEPFVQLFDGKEAIEGTGLGLSISRQFVELLGGDLSVTSEVGKGSTFRFNIQAKLAEVIEDLEPVPVRRIIGIAPGQPRYRILIVEDRESNRQLLLRLLEPLDLSIREAVNGQEAIEFWEEWDPDLILMDIQMPIMDGREAIRRIRATPKGKDTRIVALTAAVFEDVMDKILSEGCDDFIGKPFRREDIYDKLAKHLGIEFVYETQHEYIDDDVRISDFYEVVLTPDALAGLTPEEMENLKRAAAIADIEILNKLIDGIAENDPSLSEELRDLVNHYRYDKIISLIESAGG